MTPYEVRLELIKMAEKYFDTQYQAALDLSKQAMSTYLSSVKDTNIQSFDWKKFVPASYTFADVIEKAKELNGFVSTKNGN